MCVHVCVCENHLNVKWKKKYSDDRNYSQKCGETRRGRRGGHSRRSPRNPS